MGCGPSTANGVATSSNPKSDCFERKNSAELVQYYGPAYRDDMPNVAFLLAGGEGYASLVAEHTTLIEQLYPDVKIINYEEYIQETKVIESARAYFPTMLLDNLQLLNEEDRKQFDKYIARVLVQDLLDSPNSKGSRTFLTNYPRTPSEFIAFDQAISLKQYHGDELDKDPSVREAARRASLAAEASGFPSRVHIRRAYILEHDNDEEIQPVSKLLGRRGLLRRVPPLLPNRAVNLMVESAPQLFTTQTFSKVFFVGGVAMNNTHLVSDALQELTGYPVMNVAELPNCEKTSVFGEYVDAKVAVQSILDAIPKYTAETEHNTVIIHGFPQTLEQWAEWQDKSLSHTFTSGIILPKNTYYDTITDMDKVDELVTAEVNKYLDSVASTTTTSATSEEPVIVAEETTTDTSKPPTAAAAAQIELCGDANVLNKNLTRTVLEACNNDKDAAIAKLITSTKTCISLCERVCEEPSLLIITHTLGKDAIQAWLRRQLVTIGQSVISNDDEITCAIIKPDVSNLEATSSILRIAKENRFEIAMEQLRSLTSADIDIIYEAHKEQPFYPELVKYMTSGPSTIVVLKGKGAIGAWNRLVGPTDSNKARLLSCNFIRSQYGKDVFDNAVHGSRTPQAANREIQCLFPGFATEHLNTTNEVPKLLLAGGPASGKGSQAELLYAKLHLVHISTGELLRNEKAKGSTLGLEAASYFENGQLVPDSVMIPLVINRVQEDDCVAKGWMLDGFPRTPEQAIALKEAQLNADLFVLIDVSDEMLVKRVCGRRMHKETGKIYHLLFNPPPEGTPEDMLDQRADDTEEKVKGRIATFKKHVATISAQFGDRLCLIPGERDKMAVFEDIISFL